MAYLSANPLHRVWRTGRDSREDFSVFEYYSKRFSEGIKPYRDQLARCQCQQDTGKFTGSFEYLWAVVLNRNSGYEADLATQRDGVSGLLQ